MRPAPTLRPLCLAHSVDLATEAARNDVSPEDLAQLARHGARAHELPALSRAAEDSSAAESTDRLFALGGLTPAETEIVASGARVRGIATLSAMHASHATRGAHAGCCYLSGPAGAIVSLVRSLPAPISDAAPFVDPSLAGNESARTLRIRGRTLPLNRIPLIMGILNVTPDSFSDGGAYSTLEAAVRRAEALVEQGADLVDIGGESTRPGSDPVPAEIERQRVIPVIDRLGAHFPVPISIDTHKASIASEALSTGASIVNDVTGLRADPAVAEIAAAAGAAVVVSHIRGTPKTMGANPQYDDLMYEIASELLESARCAIRAGVPRESIIIDPGIGFGKTFEHNTEILRRLPELAGLGLPVLVGASRKSFLGAIMGTPPERRLEGSLAAAALARQGGAAIVRVHDVAETRRFLDTLAAIAPLEAAPRRLD